MLLVEDKQIVVPGEILAEGDYHSGRGTFKEEEKVCSSLVGLVAVRDKKISVIPLQSKYIPKRGDVVIGKVSDIRFSMWNLDINSPYSGILPAAEVFGKEKRELNRAFNVGDVLFLRVVDVDEVKKVKLGLKGRGLGKFRGGILINITPTKVPRLIGKKGSMINMIKDQTRCEVVVGQNGVVWVKGKPEMERVVQKVVKTIEEEAHTSGLTDRIRDMLVELLGDTTAKPDPETPDKKEEDDEFEEKLIQ
nr:exosome complex RNA-binding protein Rrp4 [uncultured Methanobacterium sp.]